MDEILSCDWENDDMDGGDYAPRWCGWNGTVADLSWETNDDEWECPLCGTVRER